MMVPLYVGRTKSINAVEEGMRGNREILLAAQKKAKTNDPSQEDIYTVGTVGQIMQHIKRPDGTVKVLVEGKRRTRITRFLPNDAFFLCEVEDVEEIIEHDAELEALLRTVRESFESYARLSQETSARCLGQHQVHRRDRSPGGYHRGPLAHQAPRQAGHAGDGISPDGVWKNSTN